MRGLEAVFLLLILLFLCVGCVGFYYFCNSYAVEQAIGDLTDGVVGLVGQVALGLLYILIGVAIAVSVMGLGLAAKNGAEAVGRAVILLMAAPAVKGAIEQGQTTRLPGPFTIERPQATPYEIEEPRRVKYLPRRQRYGQNAAAEGQAVREAGSQSHWKHSG